MHQSADDFTLIEGGKEHSFSGTAARTAGGLYLANSQQGIGIVWPQMLGVMPYGVDTLAIIASFCLVTVYGPGVATLARVILDRRISELREGGEYDGARIDKITIEGNVPKPTPASGFTLVELSMVLVIIGLIVGAVLVGRDMIRGAEIRATISQIEKYKTAANTFREKYNCIPGDCASATTFGLGQSGGPGDNGNGDRLIKQFGSTATILGGSEAKESLNFWFHLAQAGLYGGPANGWLNAWNAGDNSASLLPLNNFAPQSKSGANGVIIPYTFDDISNNPPADIYAYNSFAIIAPYGFCCTGYPLTPIQAYGIDVKIDDGKPCTGSVVTTYSEWRLRASCPGICNTGNTYPNGTSPVCGLVIGKAW